ncbi:MAG: hypothetical protein IJ966_06555 [Bacilli bacterium]|nr:hypothetical protein [Bacilli bacterium]
MKNENKYAKKWYERYHAIAIGCIILSISLVIMLLYFLLIKNLFDVIVICVILSMCLFSSVAAFISFIKCKQIKKDIDNNKYKND